MNHLKLLNSYKNLMIYNNYSSFLAEVVDSVENGETYKYGDIRIEHAEGEKCERCWNYSDELGSVGELDHLCPRCQEVVKH